MCVCVCIYTWTFYWERLETSIIKMYLMNSYPTISHGWCGFSPRCPLCETKESQSQRQPRRWFDQNFSQVSIAREYIHVYIYIILHIYIHMWPYMCVLVFNHIQLHLICSITLLECNEIGPWSHWKVTKSRTRSRCVKRERVYVNVVPAGFWWFYTYFVILLFRNSE